MILGKLLISNILILIASTRLANGMKGDSIVKEVLEKHRSLAEHKLGDLYFPKSSCFFSSVPKNGKNITSGPFPLNHNIFEFGFFGSNFPSVASAFIKLNKKCYFRVNVIKRDLKRPVLEFQSCFKSKSNCSVYAKYTYERLDEDECYFFSFGVGDDMKIYYGISIGCSAPSTNVFQPEIYTKIKNEKCDFEAKSKFEAELDLEAQKEYKGIVVLLPCNPEGYVVDYKTGKLAADDYYNNTFWYSHPKPGSGFSFVVKHFLKGDKSKEFPTKKYSEEDVQNRIPLYIIKGGDGIIQNKDENKTSKSREKNKPKGKSENNDKFPFIRPNERSLLIGSNPNKGKPEKDDIENNFKTSDEGGKKDSKPKNVKSKKKDKADKSDSLDQKGSTNGVNIIQGKDAKESSNEKPSGKSSSKGEKESDEASNGDGKDSMKSLAAKQLLNILLSDRYSALIEEHPIFVIKF